MQSATRKIVGTALFAALSFVVSLLEFPIFPAAGFLKLDFSAVFTLLGGFMYGPVAALVICAVKELIRFAMGSGTGGVGEIANFVVTAAFIIIPTTVYRFKKGLPVVIITLIAGIFLQVCAAVIANRFIMFPLYMGDGAASAFSAAACCPCGPAAGGVAGVPCCVCACPPASPWAAGDGPALG